MAGRKLDMLEYQQLFKDVVTLYNGDHFNVDPGDFHLANTFWPSF